MRKRKAGERKRTVTVTVGPVCERLMAEIHLAMMKTPGFVGVSPTTLTGVGLVKIVKEWAEIWKVPVPMDWCHAGL